MKHHSCNAWVKTFCFLFWLTISLPLSAQEPADTIKSKVLDEVVVDGKRTTLIRNGISMVPSFIEKKNAADGFALLLNMQPPHIKIDPIDEKITTLTGIETKYFIDGTEASLVQIKNIPPQQVARIEVLDNPTESNFKNSESVINFILKKQDTGGYLNLTGSQSFLYDTGNYSAYSKIKRGKSTYEAIIAANYVNSKGSVSDTYTHYSFIDDRNPVDIQRSSYTETKKDNNRIYQGGLQWTYNVHDSLKMVTKAGVSHSRYPKAESGYVILNGDSTQSNQFSEIQFSNMYINWDMDMKLAKKQQMSIAVGINGCHNKTDYNYTTLKPSEYYNNATDEKGMGLEASVNYDKEFSDRFTGIAFASTEMSHFNTIYKGTDNSRQKLTTADSRFGIRLRYAISGEWALSFRGALFHSYLKSAGYKSIRDCYPIGNITLNGTLYDKHNFSLSFSASTMGKIITAYNSVLQQDTELEGNAGNMDLKMSPLYNCRFSYDWLLSNKFYLSIGMDWEMRHNDYIQNYFIKEGIVYSQTSNSGGNNNELSFSLGSTLKLWNNSIILSPGVIVTRNVHSGIYPTNFWDCAPYISLRYLSKTGFYLTAYFSYMDNTKTYRKGEGGITTYHYNNLQLQTGYNLKNFDFILSIRPLYNNIHSSYTLSGNHVYKNSQEWSKYGKRRIMLTVKRVFHNNC